MNISEIRHPKEALYRTICLIVGSLIWLALLLGTYFFVLIFLIPIAISLWIAEKFFQVSVYGNAVNVNSKQYPAIDTIAKEFTASLDLKKQPEIFVVNSQGMTNALAIKFLSGKYVLLYSDLVDLLWQKDNKEDQLRFVIAHELAHHAAGHMNFWTNLIMKPAKLIPFLGAAYNRSCELTSDRIAAELVKNQKASIDALIALASGSASLFDLTDKVAFIEQENRVPSGFGFIQEVGSSHPRMTKRVMAVNEYGHSKPAAVRNPNVQAA
ncbi:M48 family metallopeptidase [Enterovibrio makurazakiensis]|uniref:M48 family metallopeptidase n=1 Tax=Enterovibrio makurazakiensis TaxID=2910232 RepID=UPI003D22A33D